MYCRETYRKYTDRDGKVDLLTSDVIVLTQVKIKNVSLRDCLANTVMALLRSLDLKNDLTLTSGSFDIIMFNSVIHSQ